jgi:hypothetical protein
MRDKGGSEKGTSFQKMDIFTIVVKKKKAEFCDCDRLEVDQ